jgi:hypothetical protein
MKIRLAASFAVVVASGALTSTMVSGTAVAARRAVCPTRRHVHVVKHDLRAEVYQGYYGELKGCSFATGRPYPLGPYFGVSSQGGGGVSTLVLAGNYVAYQLAYLPFEAEQSDPTSWYIVVRDLRSGRIVHKEPTGTSSEPAEIGLNEAASLVVSDTGAVAWIVINRQTSCQTKPERHCAQVHAIDQDGARVVAEAPAEEFGTPGINVESLRLRGQTLSWLQEETRKHLTLH